MQLRARTREREKTHKKQLMIFFELREWYFLAHTHKHRRKIFSIPTWDRARTPIRPRENIPNLRERESAFVVFSKHKLISADILYKELNLCKSISQKQTCKYHTCYSFVNYLCKSKNYKRKTVIKIHHIHSTIARESESVRARARERESSETWVIS